MRVEPLGFKDCGAAAALEKEAFGENGWSRKDFEDSIKLDYAYYFCAKVNGEFAGLAGARLIAGDAFISNVSVSNKFRRRGVAGELMRELMSELEKKGASACTLEVRSKNTAAIGLYKKLGFSSEGLRRGFYSEPYDDAVIMWKRRTQD